MLFSIVTVCFNASALIEKTIKSVLAQDFTDYEYIIQDGGSTDDTLDIVRKFKGDFEMRNIPYVVNSGKDNGIYDAMNKAVSSASGKYIIFMNADDCFYSQTVLSDVLKKIRSDVETRYNFNNVFYKNEADYINTLYETDAKLFPDIIYGDCMIKELDMYFSFRKCFNDIKNRMPFSHQACFAKRSLLLDTPLNTEYKITADYDFLLKSYLNSKAFLDSNVCIALVTADGLSSIHMYDTFVEVNKVCSKLGVPRFTTEQYNKKIKEMRLKQFILSHFPKAIIKSIRASQIKKRGQLTDVTVPIWAK